MEIHEVSIIILLILFGVMVTVLRFFEKVSISIHSREPYWRKYPDHYYEEHGISEEEWETLRDPTKELIWWVIEEETFKQRVYNEIMAGVFCPFGLASTCQNYAQDAEEYGTDQCLKHIWDFCTDILDPELYEEVA